MHECGLGFFVWILTTSLHLVQLSPIIDRTVLKTVKAAFGGNVRFVVSGGAPLGPSVESFLNITLCCPVLQVCSPLTGISCSSSPFTVCCPCLSGALFDAGQEPQLVRVNNSMSVNSSTC